MTTSESVTMMMMMMTMRRRKPSLLHVAHFVAVTPILNLVDGLTGPSRPSKLRLLKTTSTQDVASAKRSPIILTLLPIRGRHGSLEALLRPSLLAAVAVTTTVISAFGLGTTLRLSSVSMAIWKDVPYSFSPVRMV
jgi:hypothetical protein